jgi:hypothetical protein
VPRTEDETYRLDLTEIEARDVRGAIDATLIRLHKIHGQYLGDEGFAKIARLEDIARQLPEDV